MIFYITMPTFDCGSFYGAAYAEIYNFNENNISIFGSGASTIYIDSDSKYWDVKLSGASDLEMVGFGKSLDLEISGASKVHAPDLNLNNIDLNVSGSSIVWIFANKEINGKASGASQVICSGNASINVKLTGASRIDRN
jgi:Putative auto-transporter adhesin, head GIN domain